MGFSLSLNGLGLLLFPITFIAVPFLPIPLVTVLFFTFFTGNASTLSALTASLATALLAIPFACTFCLLTRSFVPLKGNSRRVLVGRAVMASKVSAAITPDSGVPRIRVVATHT